MDSTRILAAPGIRTVPYLGWRSQLATAARLVIGRPQLVLLGMASFCLRGGVVLVTVPIIILPTQVEIRLLLGDFLGTSGFTDRFYATLALVAVAAAVVTLGALVALARLELAAFEHVTDPEGEPAAPARFVVAQLLMVQVLTLVAVAVAAAPLVQAAADTAYREIIRPSSSAPIYERVLDTLGVQLLAFAIALLVIELVSALTTREVLSRASVIRALAASVARILRAPVRTLATALAGWAITVVLLLPALGGVAIAWAGVRGAFLTSVSFANLVDNMGMAVLAVALAGAFSLAVCLGGFASALRAALWSVDRFS